MAYSILQDDKQIDVEELHDALMSATSVVVVDIETTGFSPEKHAEIIQIGAIRWDIERGCPTGKLDKNIRPSNTFSIPAKITELTGITWEDVKDKEYIEQVLPQLADLIGSDPIVAHNAAFDWYRFLLPAFRSIGIHMNNDVICSMRLSKKLFPRRGQNGYSLESMCAMYGVTIKGHHRAYDDCRYTMSLFLRLLNEYRARYGMAMQAKLDWDRPMVKDSARVGQVDFRKMRIYRVAYNSGISKRHGPRIYVSTNFGRLCYSVRRRMWTVVDLWSECDAPVSIWGASVLNALNMDADSFVANYSA